MKLVKPFAWVGGAVCVAGVISLGCVLNIAWLGIALGLIILVSLVIITVKELKEKFCSSCKQQYDFDKDVEYCELSRQIKTLRTNPNSNSRQPVAKLYYKVRFDCTCGKCGAKKTFVKNLLGGTEYDDGDTNIVNVEDVIEKQYRYKGLSVNDNKTIGATIAIGVISVTLSIIVAIGGFSIGSGFKGKTNLETSDYYGTYYGVSEEFTEVKLTISDRQVITRIKNVLEVEGSSQQYDNEEQVFYTAEYMEFKDMAPDFEFYGGLALDDGGTLYWFYITDNTEGDATFSVIFADGEVVELTKTEKTVSTVTNDPKNYYGYYAHNANNYVEVTQNYCRFTLNGSTKTYSYVYANNDLFNVLGKNANSGLVLIISENQYYWFSFESGDLMYNGQNRFSKI